jgi:hypothetical protein
MDGRFKTNVAKYPVCMFFPKSWQFRVTLHCQEDKYDKPGWDRRPPLVLSPPIQESFIRMDIKTLLWWRSFRKSTGDVGTRDKEVLNKRHSIEYPRVWSTQLA